MKEMQKELQSIANSIQQIVGNVDNIVTVVEKMAQTDQSEHAKAKRAPVRKKVVVKNGVVEKIRRVPGTQIVFDSIKKSSGGMDTAALMKATGFNSRKIHNITFRLKKKDRIRNVGRGVYEVV